MGSCHMRQLELVSRVNLRMMESRCLNRGVLGRSMLLGEPHNTLLCSVLYRAVCSYGSHFLLGEVSLLSVLLWVDLSGLKDQEPDGTRPDPLGQ